tara:strand:- start:980 stop:2572 length:1593 start_codon:yes stop_codon:yes gene_type:complete
MKIAGLCSGHDCSFAILDNGVPTIHAELERYLRVKEPLGDSLEFLFDTYAEYNEIKHFTHCVDNWNGGIRNRYPETYNKMQSIVKQNSGIFYEPGHHESHAANAFFSSNFDEALIVTIDGGGRDYDKNGNVVITTFTIWKGEGNKIKPIMIIPIEKLNLGVMWQLCTTNIFGLSGGYPKGNQAGSVMAMAVMGDPSEHYEYFKTYGGNIQHTNFDFARLQKLASESEEQRFNIAAAMQKVTEDIVRSIILKYAKQYPSKNLCLAGGVVLNSVMSGKMFDWFKDIYEDIYMCPVPYDAGLAIGSAQWVWHQELDNPRITWDKNASPYLGELYDRQAILSAIENFNDKVTAHDTDDTGVLVKLNDQKIVSVFSGGSESGRRALGNRSILADPRSPLMKDLINEKVKHRQWYRPFAPAILREDVTNWFVRDIESPYMGFVIKFKPEVIDKVPAVVHHDGSGRLQTVRETDNKWFHGFLKQWKDMTQVPILLNTSFNDREPIVETPEDAIKCFLKTDIDYLYFCDEGILLEKNE